MSIATIILGESGTGKSTSLRNLKPADTLLIQAIAKPLPFRSKDWQAHSKDIPTGNIFVRDDKDSILHLMRNTKRKIIVIDDVQYIMANEFMRRVLDKEVGNQAFAKYNEIARTMWEILNTANQLAPDVRVYLLWHTQTDENGKTKSKTIGKLLDEKITIEGMVSIVLRTAVVNGNYLFTTKNSGNDTVKTPMGLIDDETIPNDLAYVDACITEYYNLTQPTELTGA